MPKREYYALMKGRRDEGQKNDLRFSYLMVYSGADLFYRLEK